MTTSANSHGAYPRVRRMRFRFGGQRELFGTDGELLDRVR